MTIGYIIMGICGTILCVSAILLNKIEKNKFQYKFFKEDTWRILVTFFLLVSLVLVFFGGYLTTQPNPNTTPKELIQTYLQAIHNKDYKVILSLVPKEIEEHFVKEIQTELNLDEKNARKYELTAIESIVNTYDWLGDAKLSEQNNFTFEITNEITIHNENDIIEAQNYIFTDMGVHIEFSEVSSDEISIKFDDNTEIIGTFLSIKNKNGWYLTSFDPKGELVAIDDLISYLSYIVTEEGYDNNDLKQFLYENK